MKHVVSKGEKNAEGFDSSEVNAIIRAGINYLFEKFGTNADFPERKSLSKTIHELFPQMSYETTLKKLSMKLYNTLRKPKEKRAGKTAEVRVMEANDDEMPSAGFEDSNDNDCKTEEFEFVDYEYLKDEIIHEVDSSDDNKDESKDGTFEKYSVY